MKNTRLKAFFVISIITSSTSYADTTTGPQTTQAPSPAQRATASAMAHAQLDVLFDFALKNLDLLDEIIQDLGQKVHNNAIVGIDKPYVQTHLQTMRSNIHMLRTNTQNEMTPAQLQLLVQANAAISAIIQDAITSGLKQITPLTPEMLISRKQSPSSIAEFKQALTAQQEKLDQIDKQCTTIGLNNFNILFRKWEKADEKYSISQRATLLGSLCIVGGIIGGAWLYAKVPEENCENKPWLKFFKNIVGSRKFTTTQIPTGITKTTFSASGEVIGNQIETKMTTIPTFTGSFGFAEKKLLYTVPYIQQYAPALSIGGMIFGPTIGQIAKNELSRAKKAWDKKNHQIKNILRGGPPREYGKIKEKSDITFDDVIGMKNAKQQMLPYIDYLLNPEKYDQAGIQPPKGILLSGASRTGKTFFVEALFGEIRKQMTLNGIANPNLKYLHVTRDLYQVFGNITNLIFYAKSVAPCIVFIDEIDLYGLQRERDREELNRFLIGMSGCESGPSDKQVILVCATNRPDLLDFALTKRFGKQIYVGYPNQQEIKSFLHMELSKRVIDTEQFDLDRLAQEAAASECSYEDLNMIIKTACQYARIYHKPVSQELIDITMNKYIRKILPETKKLSEAEKNIIAAHLTGHALATLLFDTPEKLQLVTTLPYNKKIQEDSVWSNKKSTDHQTMDYGKCFTGSTQDTLQVLTQEQLDAKIKYELAGSIAEKILLNSTTHSYHPNDTQSALELTKKIVLDGLDEDTLPQSIRDEKIALAIKTIEAHKKELEAILTSKKHILEAIYKELRENKALTADEIKEIFDTHNKK